MCHPMSSSRSFANNVVVLSSIASLSWEMREFALACATTCLSVSKPLPPSFQSLSLSASPPSPLFLPPNPSTTLKDSLRGRRLSPKQLGGSRDCSSADVFPPSQQDESIAEDELLPVEEGEERTRDRGEEEEEVEEEEGEERTRDEKRSEEEEEVDVEGQSERDGEEEGTWQREESGSEEGDEIDDKATKGRVEAQKARDETEERNTPDSDKIMERYVDQVDYSEEEEEQSEKDEEGEKNCDVQNKVVGETKERADSDGVNREGVERGRNVSDEQRGDADECRSEGEREHPESESDDREIERLPSMNEKNADVKGMLGKKSLLHTDRLLSEVRSVTFDPSPHDLMLFMPASLSPVLLMVPLHPSIHSFVHLLNLSEIHPICPSITSVKHPSVSAVIHPSLPTFIQSFYP